jgi:ligand-binding SRPBCC domain-containing protein
MKHQHLFARENGQTIMQDIFQFESPFGLVGRSVNNLFLKNYMKNLLISRNKVIKSHIETTAQL